MHHHFQPPARLPQVGIGKCKAVLLPGAEAHKFEIRLAGGRLEVGIGHENDVVASLLQLDADSDEGKDVAGGANGVQNKLSR